MPSKPKPPVSPHFAHLPFAHQPLKSLYVFQRLLTTLLLVPLWALYFTLLPRSHRPRPSWSLRQVIFVYFTRRIYKVTEVAGMTYGTRDPEEAPEGGGGGGKAALKETRFEWAQPLEEGLRTGVVAVDSKVPFKKVGLYVWPKDAPPKGDSGLASYRDGDLDAQEGGAVPLVGIFFHGGGYCHMSAHEESRTSKIPRRLVQDHILTTTYAVEYRLLQHAHFPATIQDAGAAYAHVLSRYNGRCKVILIGDSSGGNLALAVARWIRDEGKLRMPDGLLLLSPSTDISHAFPKTPSSYIPRPHADTDYLVDTPEPRALLQRVFLGFPYRPLNNKSNHNNHPNNNNNKSASGNSIEQEQREEEERRLMEVVHSEYVSPASPRVLKRWGHPVEQYEDGVVEEGDRRAARVAAREMFDEGSVNGSVVSVAGAGGEGEGNADADGNNARVAGANARRVEPPQPQPYSNPIPIPNPNPTKFSKLFESFPRTMVVVGDAERLEREISSLVGAMERDGVDVTTMWVKDGVHDMLIVPIGWGDEKARERIWGGIGEWVKGF